MATLVCRVQFLDDTDPFNSTNFPEPTRPPLYTFREDISLINQIAGLHRLLQAPHKLDDCALQLSHNGTYLDLESNLAEQKDELEGFLEDPGRGKKHSMILRTQLSVRVHACIEKLYNSCGRELRRALFSLKQIFQDDKDLVHEFVVAEGLTCLIKVGAEADQNYQNYILRALGQIMLYVDGMNGLIDHSETIQWLYTLIGSKFRLVVKTALKLLLVFVEYTESNAPLLIQAVTKVDHKRGVRPWSNVMEILDEKDGIDTELLVYAMTLINKTLAGLPDQDSFYDVVDCLEEQAMEAISQRHLNKKGTDLDLVEQFNIYEMGLKHEDGDDDTVTLSGRKNRRRSSLGVNERRGLERRRSRRHSVQNIKSSLSAPTSPCSPLPGHFRSHFLLASGQRHEDLSEKDEEYEEEEAEEEQPVTESNTEDEGEDDPSRQGQESQLESSYMNKYTDSFEPYTSRSSNRYSSYGSSAYTGSRYYSGLTAPTTSSSHYRTSVSPAPEAKSDRPVLGGLLSSSYRQHQESLAAEREKRRQEREERLQRIEREERNRFNRGYIEKREEQRLAREERYKYLEKLAAEEYEKEARNRVPRARSDLSLSLTSPAAPSSPTPSCGTVSPAESQDKPKPPPEACESPQPTELSAREQEPEAEPEPESEAERETEVVAEAGPAELAPELETEQGPDREPEENVILSEKERQNEEVNEKDNCSASSISSASSTLEREEREDKVTSDNETGKWTQSIKEVSVNEQCSNILNNKRFMLDMLYAQNKKTDDGEEIELEKKEEERQESLASLASRISILQANKQACEDKVKKMEIDHLENHGSVKAFADKFNSGELSKGPPLSDSEVTTKVMDKVIAQPKTESDYIWDQLMANPRELKIKDIDFTDLEEADDVDVLDMENLLNSGDTILPPPPPPLSFMGLPPPPPPPTVYCPPPPPVPGVSVPPPPTFGLHQPVGSPHVSRSEPTFIKKKKTIRLFWNEVRPIDWQYKNHKRCREPLWTRLEPVKVDISKLEHLFESKSKELPVTKKTAADGKRQEVIVLDSKRSNAINIGLTVLPPPRTIKTAILNFDEYALNKEGIEKILTMIPSEEEKQKIQEAQLLNPDIPLGSAEQFLLTLSSISELSARLQLWAFKLDYETVEKEVAEPLQDLKEGMDQLENNKSLRYILATILAIGNFLNASNAKGFELGYLEKVPEVKDTVHKQSLLHHIATIVVEKFPDSSDLYSEIGAITRSAKVDFDQLQENLCHLERRCKASWDHLKAIAKHEIKSTLKQKMSEFLKDCAERIIILKIVHRRVMNRFHAFLLFMGHPPHAIREVNIHKFCKIISEFALEYRTTRDRVLQQKQKRANHRERNKTRGKMITDTDDEEDGETGKFSSNTETVSSESQLQGLQSAEEAAEHENMKAVLKTSVPCGEVTTAVPGVRTRTRANRGRVGSWTAGNDDSPNATDDAADEIMDRIVKSATQVPNQRAVPRERKRSRANRKSLRRTLKSGLTPEEAKALGLLSTSEMQV
ncbi:FH1/FH2 domain-containing protein 3 isoform X8 [Scyliorhinus canicula]|uniref:FH1/FH2 domain-containing protein 3 isoform X8 n=1 Tax=Scyliorhinus canicula TaxID=7830 RepID=UPI0018F6C8A4|nr:FH1/FH2 domain-containing protein 3 isoform X8 [Scyliorhinus canicula]